MPRVSETLFKLKGGKRYHASVKRMTNYLPTYKHQAVMLPNVLGNKVSEAKPKSKQGLCLDEVQEMMSCWKRNEFKENTCQAEYLKYAQCITALRKESIETKKFADSAELGQWSTNDLGQKKINPKQVNRLLGMYPQPPYKVSITHAHEKKLNKTTVFEGEKKENGKRS